MPTECQTSTPGAPGTARVSVVMPVYNEAATIRLVVERVLAQGVVAELVVVDDASDDGTWDAVQAILTERAGQDVGPIDGWFGARTAAGWRNVQAWCQWPRVDDDIVGDDWDLLAWVDKGWSRLNAAGVR